MEAARTILATVDEHARSVRLAVALVAAAVLAFPAVAQEAPPGILANGNAAVTGFSGATLPAEIAPGEDPADKTFITLNGPSLRIVDLQHMDGPPVSQLVAAPKPTTWFAEQIGQVFEVVLDVADPPNIYVAATSAYGLPIVAPAASGQPIHLRRGTPNATFMPGLWGPGGGPGSIWKIDGRSGAVSLFANVKLADRPNSGPALGGLAFDAASNSLYVADRETGFIHRLAMNGHELDRFDHGTVGRQAQGLPPVAFGPTKRLDITDPAFDSGDPATWNYAAPERRIFGLGILDHRLYYAVAAGLQIWSVGLGPDGSFGSDPTLEIAVPPTAGPSEISKIVFDEQGRMVLAERPAPTGAGDFEMLAVPGIGRVLRYARINPDPDAERNWQPLPDEYAIGFPLQLRNGNGGIDIGYIYDAKGDIDHAVCGGFLWSTGEHLRASPEPSLAARLRELGAENVDGLQGNGSWLTRHDDEPPLASYFIDYDDRFDDGAARGHMGDIAIARACTPARRASFIPRLLGGLPGGGLPPGETTPPTSTPTPPPPPPPTTPPGNCPPGQGRAARTGACCGRPSVLIGGKCCSPADLAPGGACSNASCGAGQTPIGPSNFCCNSNQVYTSPGGAQACCSGPLVNGQCASNPPGSICHVGYVPTGGGCCLASQLTSTGVCCPSGEAPSGPGKNSCQKINLIPIKIPGQRCCVPGLVPTQDGSCCAPDLVTTTGICCQAGYAPDPTNRSHCLAQTQVIVKCAAGYTKMPDGSCCNNRLVSADGMSCRTIAPLVPLVPNGPRACPPGAVRDSDGDCVRRSPPGCGLGEILLPNGKCVRRGRLPCPPGMIRTPRGVCIRVGPPARFRVPPRHPIGVIR